MTSRLRRTLAGGLLAAATATGMALAGAGTANAVPQSPSHDGESVGERAYYQGGGDPNIHLFTWTNSGWRYDGCLIIYDYLAR